MSPQHGSIRLISVSVRVQLDAASWSWRVLPSGKLAYDLHTVQTGTVSVPPRFRRSGRAVRDRFLSVEANPDAALRFLNSTGYFANGSLPSRPIPSDLEEFEKFQQVVKALLTTKPSQWPKVLEQYPKIGDTVNRNKAPALALNWEGNVPIGVVTAVSVVGAIVASILVDRWAGAEFRMCKNPRCRKVFEVTDARKIFCNGDCAHRSAVRAYKKRKRDRRMRDSDARR